MARFFLHLFIFCTGISFLSMVASADEPMVHVILAVDGNAGFGANLEADSKNMERIFRENVPKSQLDIVLMDTNKITPDNILETVAKVQVDENDTLVFYYSGHGANDAANGGHYFQFKDENGKTAELRRTTLLSHIKEKSPRLAVLLTDCCNIDMKSSDRIKEWKPEAAPKKISPLFQSLFVEPEGIVNITSSKRGEASFVDTSEKKRGSCFTWPLVDLLEEHKDDTEMTWPDFSTLLKTAVHKAFLESWPDGYKFDPPLNNLTHQKTQTIEIYGQLPGQTSSQTNRGPRFGVRAVNHPNGGVRVTEVVPDGPGSRAGFEAGDVILEINGEKIADEQDYSLAIDQSPQRINMKVLNVQNNETLDINFDLGY